MRRKRTVSAGLAIVETTAAQVQVLGRRIALVDNAAGADDAVDNALAANPTRVRVPNVSRGAPNVLLIWAVSISLPVG